MQVINVYLLDGSETMSRSLLVRVQVDISTRAIKHLYFWPQKNAAMHAMP